MRWLATVVLVLAACATGEPVTDAGEGGAIDADISSIDAEQVMPDANIVGGPDAFFEMCMQTPCDLYPQCGCNAAAGEVCDLDFSMLSAEGITECRSVTVPGTEASTCTVSTGCAGGHVCVGGRCRRYCDTDTDCPGDGGICLVQLTVGTPPVDIGGAITCTTMCDPILTANNGCPPTWACHVYNYMMSGITDCEPDGGGGDGATCATSSDCSPGLDCVTIGMNMTCEPTCVCPNGNCAQGTCPPNTGTCGGFVEPPVIDGITYGVCT
jgi:hypothetical protein